MLNEKKINKIGFILEVTIFLIIVLCLIIFKYLPILKENIGSSDWYVDLKEYTSVVGIEVENNASFALVLKKDEVLGILFFNKEALIVYNKGIEKLKYNKALEKITEIFVDNNIKTKIKVINYSQDNDIYDKIKVYMLKKYNNSVDFSKSSLKDKVRSLNIEDVSTEEEALVALYSYSYSLIKHNRNNNVLNNTTNYNGKKYAVNIYKKLVNYALYINDQPIIDDKYPIQLIEVDSDIIENNTKRIFPNSNSWYYIENGKVYAYIEFNDEQENYGFCFSGDIDAVKEGNCDEKSY